MITVHDERRVKKSIKSLIKNNFNLSRIIILRDFFPIGSTLSLFLEESKTCLSCGSVGRSSHQAIIFSKLENYKFMEHI